MAGEKWNRNPERWNRRQKTEGEAIAKVSVKAGTDIVRELGKAWAATKQADADVEAQKLALERITKVEAGRIHESNNETTVALDKAAKDAEKAKDKQITKREKNNKKYENQKSDIDQKWKAFDRYLDHLERQDDLELMRLQQGLPSSANHSRGSADAIAGSMTKFLTGSQIPEREMPQATSSANSNHEMVLRK